MTTPGKQLDGLDSSASKAVATSMRKGSAGSFSDSSEASSIPLFWSNSFWRALRSSSRSSMVRHVERWTESGERQKKMHHHSSFSKPIYVDASDA